MEPVRGEDLTNQLYRRERKKEIFLSYLKTKKDIKRKMNERENGKDGNDNRKGVKK